MFRSLEKPWPGTGADTVALLIFFSKAFLPAEPLSSRGSGNIYTPAAPPDKVAEYKSGVSAFDWPFHREKTWKFVGDGD